MSLSGCSGLGGLPIGTLCAHERGTRTPEVDAQTDMTALICGLFGDGAAPRSEDNHAILHDLPLGWPVRDQGRVRGTCVAFAALSAFELYRYWHGVAVQAEDLSEERLYKAMREDFDIRDRVTGTDPAALALIEAYERYGASLLWQAGSALDAMGAAAEADAPYVWDAFQPAFHVKEPMTDTFVAKQGEGLRHYAFEMPDPEDRPPFLSAAVRYLLSRKVPVCLSFPVLRQRGDSHVWAFGPGWDTGIISDPDLVGAPLEDGQPQNLGGHSVCVVGYVPDEGTQEGWFLFRNSWGTRFGAASDFVPGQGGAHPVSPPRGYGLISSAHVDTHGWEMMFIGPKRP
ncbi:MAG: hypothetical protein AAGF60_15535 [Pseudomonadota bacterium]